MTIYGDKSTPIAFGVRGLPGFPEQQFLDNLPPRPPLGAFELTRQTTQGALQTKAFAPESSAETVAVIEGFRQGPAGKPTWASANIAAQSSKAKEPIYSLLLKHSTLTEDPSRQWALRHRTFFYDLSEDLLRQSTGHQGEIFSIKMLIKEWLDRCASLNKLGQMFQFAKLFISEQMANRLIEIQSEPYDPDEEMPIQPKSVYLLLEYCRRKKFKKLPDITLTPDGIVQADWNKGSEWVGMRFFLDDKVWVAIRKPSFKGAFETTVDHLLSPTTNIRLPEWV